MIFFQLGQFLVKYGVYDTCIRCLTLAAGSDILGAEHSRRQGVKQTKKLETERQLMNLKIFLYGVIAAMFSVIFSGCEINAAKSDFAIPSDAVLIDVRSAEEFRAGHLPGAVNIPHTEIAEKISGIAPEKSTPLYLYCRSGRRVGIAMETLKKSGYTTMYNLGGIEEAAKKLNIQPAND